LVFVKSIFICIKNSRRGMKLFSDYLRGCQVIFLKGLVGHEPFFEFYKIAPPPPPPPPTHYTYLMTAA
jgi:hypothetical protein